MSPPNPTERTRVHRVIGRGRSEGCWFRATQFGSPGSHIIVAGHATASILSHVGPQALREHFEDLERTTGSEVCVLNDSGQEALDQALPRQAETKAQQIRDGKPSKGLGTRRGHRVDDFVRGPNGERFIAVGQLQRPPSAMPFRTPGALAMLLTGIVMTAGVVALVLAYYVTAPVRRLRTATRRFSADRAPLPPQVAECHPSVTFACSFALTTTRNLLSLHTTV